MKLSKKTKKYLFWGAAIGLGFWLYKRSKTTKAAEVAAQVDSAKVAEAEATQAQGSLGASDYGSLGSADGNGSLGSCGFGSLC